MAENKEIIKVVNNVDKNEQNLINETKMLFKVTKNVRTFLEKNATKDMNTAMCSNLTKKLVGLQTAFEANIVLLHNIGIDVDIETGQIVKHIDSIYGRNNNDKH